MGCSATTQTPSGALLQKHRPPISRASSIVPPRRSSPEATECPQSDSEKVIHSMELTRANEGFAIGLALSRSRQGNHESLTRPNLQHPLEFPKVAELAVPKPLSKQRPTPSRPEYGLRLLVMLSCPVVADGSPRNSFPSNGSWSQFMSIRWKTFLSSACRVAPGLLTSRKLSDPSPGPCGDPISTSDGGIGGG